MARILEACAGSWSLRRKMQNRSAGHAARPHTGGRRRGGPCWRFQAANRDFKAGDALVASYLRYTVGSDRSEKRDQLGAQRLVMSDRQMPHRVTAVRFEAEALGDLAGEKIARDILIPGRDRDVARLERGQPVGVDMGEHA